MDKFLEVIENIDWDLLHEQKYELLQLINSQEQVLGEAGHLKGLVSLINEIQNVAAELKMWEFPFDGECPECRGRNYNELENNHGSYECYDCGKIFKEGSKKV